MCLVSLSHMNASENIWCEPLAKSCIETVKPDEADVNQMCGGHAPTSSKGKCLLACMGETYNIVSNFLNVMSAYG